jgi:hypothetical protein
MLPVRAYRFAKRALDAALPRVFLWAFAIPWLIISRQVRGPLTVRLGFRSAAVMDRSRLCKVALGSMSTIAREYENFAQATRKWPSLLAIFPELHLQDDGPVVYLTMPRYRPVALEDSLQLAARAYSVIGSCASSRGARLTLPDAQELLVGIQIIAELYGVSTSDKIRHHVETFLASGDYHLGFAHGDFHSRNIVLDNHGGARLIDLDCLRLNGIQELDALYFVLEWESSRSGRPWYATIVDVLQRTASRELQTMLSTGFGVQASFGLAATYLVDRIGQECRNFGVQWYTRVALDPAVAHVEAAGTPRLRVTQ